MATLLTDVIVPEVFSPYVKEMANNTSALVQSGGVMSDPILDQFLAGGGSVFNIPGWKSQDGVTFNSDSDDPSTLVTIDKVTAGVQKAARLNQNQHFGSSRFTTALAGSNPLESVASEVAALYNANRQKHLVAMLDGMFDATGPLNGEITSAATWSADVLVDAEAKFEDFTSGEGLLIVDSATFTAMRKENLIDFRPRSEQDIVFPDYLGYTVVVDNAIGDASAYVVRPGAVRLGTGTVVTDAYEDEKGGNGAGIEVLRMRDEYIMHVEGMSWDGAEINPTAAELDVPASWSAVYDLKHIGVKRIDITG